MSVYIYVCVCVCTQIYNLYIVLYIYISKILPFSTARLGDLTFCDIFFGLDLGDFTLDADEALDDDAAGDFTCFLTGVSFFGDLVATALTLGVESFLLAAADFFLTLGDMGESKKESSLFLFTAF